MRFVVGSCSDIKVRAFTSALRKLELTASVDALEVPSHVAPQPMDEATVIQGARNRARAVLNMQPRSIAVGIESGLYFRSVLQRWEDITAVICLSRDGSESVGISGGFPLPDWLLGELHGPTDDIGLVVQRLAGGGAKDPEQFLSHGRTSRQAFIEQASFLSLLARMYPSEGTRPAPAPSSRVHGSESVEKAAVLATR